MAILYSILFGIAVFILSYHYLQKFLEWLKFQSLGTRDFIVEKLNLMFIEIAPSQVLLYLVLSSVIPFLILFLLFLPNIIPGLLFGTIGAVIGWFLPRPIVQYFFDQRILKFNTQMVDALNLMSSGMKAGLSIVQSLNVVVEQMPKPISEEFGLVLSQNQVGVSVEEAFQNLAKRVPCEDVDMFVTSVNILKETGGNLSETLDTITTVIRERVKVQGKISAITAQGFIQGMILLCVPPAMGFYFGMTEPDFMKNLFTHPLGWLVLLIVVLLEVIAYYVIKNIIKIDV